MCTPYNRYNQSSDSKLISFFSLLGFVRLSSISNPFKSETSISASTLVPSSDYRDILSALQQPGIGLAVKDRSWFKVIIPDTFLGRHLVKVFLDYFCVNSSFQCLVRKTLFIKNSKIWFFSGCAKTFVESEPNVIVQNLLKIWWTKDVSKMLFQWLEQWTNSTKIVSTYLVSCKKKLWHIK